MAEVRRGTSTGDEQALPGSVPFVSLMGVVSSLNSRRMRAMMGERHDGERDAHEDQERREG
jgi:hypothetical protein